MSNNDGRPMPGATDRTVMIPTPGAGRKGAATPPPAQPASGGVADAFEIRNGLNPLVNSAAMLPTLVHKLRSTMQHDNPPDLHRRLTEEIKTFERNARNQGISQENVIAARYLLCSVIDEIVLNTPWGAGSGWSQHSLLSLFHQETSGGEKSFLILQRLLETPGTHLDILELFYLCLSLGFQGKYRVMPRGNEQLETIRDNLYNTIEQHRPVREGDLSPHWEGTVKPDSYMKNYIPVWVIACVVLAVMVLTYSGFRFWLYEETRPVAEHVLSGVTEPDDPAGLDAATTEPERDERFY